MRYNPMRRGSFGLDEFFDDMFSGVSNTSLMRTDIREKDGKYFLDIDLPGFKKEDITISLYNGNLTIKAEHLVSDEEKDEKGNIIRQERYSGSCNRSFYVGEAIKEEDVHASFKDGILTVDFPSEKKKEEQEKKFIEIL